MKKAKNIGQQDESTIFKCCKFNFSLKSNYDLDIHVQNKHVNSETFSTTEKKEETLYQKFRNKMEPTDQSEEFKC